ncbi:hypothetical protein CDSM653_00055 [Caldanaerobacter subterraneus subsp. pacificus DSM 12653]|nr:hypothetical protein CDSM653_00055 [Caldanaerobacter subterraneus subsp. pacificus DSM 12653]
MGWEFDDGGFPAYCALQFKNLLSFIYEHFLKDYAINHYKRFSKKLQN